MIFADIFSGAGGVGLAAKALGFEHGFGLELDPRIAELCQTNIGRCYVQSILDTDPRTLERPDILHASPVCKKFSTANSQKGESQFDKDCAIKISEFVQVLQPKWFTLENVRGYVKSWSFRLIVDTLNRLGYWCNWSVLNASDFGVPQSRKRLILVAGKKEVSSPLYLKHSQPNEEPTLFEVPKARMLPQAAKHVGWYEAIADIVHDLPDSKLTDGQLKAIPNLTEGIYLIEKTGARSDRPLQTRTADQPCWTIRALGQDGHWHRATALLGARVVQINIRCLARFQSFPDWYQFSGVKSVDGMGTGNSVPPPMAQGIFESLVGV